MSSLHHSFSADHAYKYGLEEAIIIQHLQFWISKNLAENKNYYDGKTWTYFTQSDCLKYFYYFKDRYKIGRIFKSLESQGVIVKGNYNKVGYDKTIWYAFKNEDEFLSKILSTMCKNSHSEMQTPRNVQKCTLESAKMHIGKCKNSHPIPDIKKDLKKDLVNQKTDDLTVISICASKKEFIGLTLEDMKEWRSKYHSLNLDKELKIIAEKSYGKNIKCYKAYINQALHNIQEKRLMEARPRQEPSLQVPAPTASNDDYESNAKIAKYIAALSDKEKVNFSYKIEFTHQGLRFNRPYSTGSIDLTLHQPSMQFRQSCKMHLSKIASHHPAFYDVMQKL